MHLVRRIDRGYETLRNPSQIFTLNVIGSLKLSLPADLSKVVAALAVWQALP